MRMQEIIHSYSQSVEETHIQIGEVSRQTCTLYYHGNVISRCCSFTSFPGHFLNLENYLFIYFITKMHSHTQIKWRKGVGTLDEAYEIWLLHHLLAVEGIRDP